MNPSSEAADQGLIVFNDDQHERGQSSSQERHETELNIRKKGSLLKLARLPDTLPERTSSKSLVTKNILNEHQEEIIFETGLKLTLNPEKGDERPESQLDNGGSGFDMVYQPGKKRRKNKFLPPLLKEQNVGKEVQISRDMKTSPFLPPEQPSSAEIVLRSDREKEKNREIEDRKMRQQVLVYRINTDSMDRRAFMMSPVPMGLVLQCTIRRDKSNFSKKHYPEYTLQLSENFHFVAAAKRLPYHCTSTYSIGMDLQSMAPTDQGCLGQLKSNFWGSHFEIYDSTLNQANPKLVGKVNYASSCCQPAAPRNMTCELANLFNNNPSQSSLELGSSVKKNLTASSNLSGDSIIELTSKKPRYDEVRKAFLLKFGSRVKRSSVKNFILVRQELEDKVLKLITQNMLLFGKCTKELFNLDISHPLTPLQGFAVALSSFDNKLVSE